jgi:Secretion system C-terminal sorting domain
LSGLTGGTDYSWYIRKNCGGFFSTWVGPTNFTTLSSCTAPTTFASSNITTSSVDLAWTETGTATIWDIYRATTSSPAPIGSTTPTYNNVTNPYTATGLSASTTYYFWVRADCGSGTSPWTGPISLTTLLANDDPSTPTALTVGAGCTGAPYTNVGATAGAGEPYPNCSGAIITPVWFSFVAPASGAVRVSTDFTGNTFADSKLAIFDGTTIISCDDDGGNTGGSFMSVAYAFGLTGGNTYLVAVDRYNSAEPQGTFCIAVDEVSASMLTTNDCGNTFAFPVGSTTYTGWVPLLDGSSKLVAMVRNPAGGNVSSYSVESTTVTGTPRQAGFYYLNRNYKINNSTATNVEVLLPYLTSEMTALNAVDPTATTASVGVTRKSTTTCDANFLGGGATFIAQASNGSANGVDFITFTTPSFSNFFIHATVAAAPLPVELTKFTGKTMASSNMLAWATATESNVKSHIIERSADGMKWVEIGSTNSKGSNSTYELEDRAPLAQAYYRLRTVDFDGQEQKSEVILLTRRDKQFGVLGVFPNPTSGDASVQFAVPAEGKVTLRVTDLTGRIVLEQTFEAIDGINTQNLSLSRLHAGTYTVTVINEGSISEPKRVVKQ